ncbi:MAG: SCP2 sterol-binding domain-containing protein [Anaerolineae bacterium]
MAISQEIQAYLSQLNGVQLKGKDVAEGLSAVIQLHLTGENGGNFGLRIHNGQINTGVGYAKTPDLTVTMSAEDFLTVIKGETDPMGMVMSGRILTDGDRMLAMRVANILTGK